MVSWSPHIEITAIDGQTHSTKLTNMEIQDEKVKVLKTMQYEFTITKTSSTNHRNHKVHN